MGLFARIVGVLTAPRATFENIVAHPKPAAVLLIVALVIGFAAMLPMALNEQVFQSTVTQQVEFTERITGKQMSAEDYQKMSDRARVGIYFAPVNVLIVLPIISMIMAGLYWVFFNAILGGMATFKQVLAIVTHSQVPAALGAVLGAPIQLMQGKMTAAGPFTLGALVAGLPPDHLVSRILGVTNVFTIWGLALSAIGLAVLYRRKTLNIFVGLTLIYLLIVAGFMSAFGRFMGPSR
jgi:hypothetical protein